MVVYEQDYRGNTLSMEAGGYFNISKAGPIYVKYWYLQSLWVIPDLFKSFDCDIKLNQISQDK